MKKLIPFLVLSVAVAGLVASAAQPVAGQAAAPGQLAIFADMALFSGNNQPRNCFTMNRFRAGEPVGFRVSVIDGATGMPAADAAVVIHLTYGGQTVDVPARYRGPQTPNLWTAKWTVPADAPTGEIGLRITATDKSGRTAEYRPFPNPASHLTVVSE
jgi:hypothetical protein